MPGRVSTCPATPGPTAHSGAATTALSEHALDESVADLDGAGPFLDGDRARGAGVGECRGETADVTAREELVRTENEVRRHRCRREHGVG